jgi:hypothetical protein
VRFSSFVFSVLCLFSLSTAEAAEVKYSCSAKAIVTHRVLQPGSRPVAQMPIVCISKKDFEVLGRQGFGQGNAVPIPCEIVGSDSPALTNLTVSIGEDPGNDRSYLLGLDTWDQDSTGKRTRILHHTMMTGQGKAPNFFSLRSDNEAKDATLSETVTVTCKRR